MSLITDKAKRPMSMNPKKFAFWLFMVTVAMLFAALTSAYLVRREAGDWKIFELPTWFIWSTVVIVLSSITHQLGFWAARKDELSTLKTMLVATLVLGLAFVYFQIIAWKELTERNIFFAANATKGISAQYYSDLKFESRTEKRIDSTINFQWALKPTEFTRPDSFSVLWNGLIEAPETGEYTFYLSSDNVRRLWVDENYIAFNTVNHQTGTAEGKISLTKGEKYALKVEYMEDTGAAQVRLDWAGPGFSRQLLPTKYLWTVSPANPSESFLYAITWLHALHIVSAIVFLLVVLYFAIRNDIHSKNLLRLELCTTYWHFLGLLWVYLYVFLSFNH
ncbi:MAG: PA14 domain-containing protein [Cytophagaceae bacterium]|jgi:heme/copper-type cytochrome/quinol oxidase subunit 3|nr:PA14 domain-containing protein [Cytophagaceae bacterium]